MRVLRVYHGGRNAAHRARDRALAAAGIELTLIVPTSWPEEGDAHVTEQNLTIVELQVERAGDVNRHRYVDPPAVAKLIRAVNPEMLDLHEEPFSAASAQWLNAAAPLELPVVMYTAQNIDKRFPPPFSFYERRAYRRVRALYPCSKQAAAVARGKGFAGPIVVLPLGYDPECYRPGTQAPVDGELRLALFGRLVPEKGVRDAVRVLARINLIRPARLDLVGDGPEQEAARELAARLGVGARLRIVPWLPARELADAYRRAHVVLVPSRTTATWVEQFGRVIVEAQASGALVAGYGSGAIPEVAGAAGVLVPEGAVDELAERIVTLASDPDEYERRRADGIAIARARTWGRVAEQQADLYQRVAAGDIRRVELPNEASARRAAARAEFGPTASTTVGARPFALPVLRRGGRLPRALGSLIDAVVAVRARGYFRQ